MKSRKNSLELIEPCSINKVISVSSDSNPGSTANDLYIWEEKLRTDRFIQYEKNSLLLVSTFINIYMTSRKNSLDVIEVSSINKVSLVQVFFL